MEKAMYAGVAAAMLLIGAPARAAVITATYDYTASFASGPYKVVNGSITATFDPLVRSLLPVTAATTSLSGNYRTTGILYSPNYVAFGNCSANGCSATWLNDQYYINFMITDRGDVAAPINFSYATVQSNVYSSDTLSIVRRPVSPSVPEPATWLMMILGFAMTGGALRRRMVPRHA